MLAAITTMQEQIKGIVEVRVVPETGKTIYVNGVKITSSDTALMKALKNSQSQAVDLVGSYKNAERSKFKAEGIVSIGATTSSTSSLVSSISSNTLTWASIGIGVVGLILIMRKRR